MTVRAPDTRTTAGFHLDKLVEMGLLTVVHQDLTRALEDFGFEPRTEGGSVLLGNCPFHSLAQRHTELVCGMNLCLLTGLADGVEADHRARPDPSPDHCCVRLDQAPSSRSPSVSR
ncbi:hypothetical protein BBK82_26185 [Lentzea guizhouensis]|uniref:Transcriptional regulator n=1 Tax=Lentzea guizhouensis TaxID=1586287 RepID=A0A1B2HMX1_9PSEU|nr:hypothetical protein [Lentzea guizhouensis]ANZ39041.1 hypothetical protein BBK82_26185 [Lentzea guizhouensis]